MDTFLVLSMVLFEVVTFIKSILPDKVDGQVTRIVSLVLGIGSAFVFDLDLAQELFDVSPTPPLGIMLTGAAIAFGGGTLHKVLQGTRKKQEPNQ